MPSPARDGVYRRIYDVLTGKNKDPKFGAYSTIIVLPPGK